MTKRLFAALAGVLLLAGCAHPTPPPIRLPTTTAVRAPIAAARASNAHAVRLAAQASKHGIAAGSEEARELSLATATTDSQLGQALARVDQLTAQLLAAQNQVDALTKHDAYETALADARQKRLVATREALAAAEDCCWHWRFAFVCLLAVGAMLVSLIGTEMEEILRLAEKAAFHEAQVLGRDIAGAALKVSWVVKVLAKVGALCAFI